MIFRWLMQLGLDVTQLQAGAKKAESAFVGIGRTARQRLGGELSNIGTAFAGMFTLSAVRSAVNNLTQVNGQIKDMAENLGVSYERAQEFQVAVSKGPVAMGKVMMAILKMEALTSQALGGDKRASGLFAVLGVDPSKGNSLDRLQGVLNGASKGVVQQAAAVDVLGNRVEGLKITMQGLKDLGPIQVISTDEILKIDAAVKSLDEAKRRMTVATAPMLVGGMNFVSTYIEEAMKALKSDDPTALLGPRVFKRTVEAMIAQSGSDPSGVALPLPDRSKSTTTAQAVEAAAAVAAENKAKDPMQRSAAGGLAASGGFFFDGPRRERQESVRHLRDIAMATKKTAEVITKEVE